MSVVCVCNGDGANGGRASDSQPEFTPQSNGPLLPGSSSIQIRPVTDVRHMDADRPEVEYVQNHTAMCPEDLAKWLMKKQDKACEGEPWIGDGNYKERRPQHLHHFGHTTLDYMPISTAQKLARTQLRYHENEIPFHSRNGLQDWKN